MWECGNLGMWDLNYGKNCSQAVLMAYADQLGLTDEAAFSLAAGFGGGIARNGEVCGAVSGAVMVLGMIHGQPGDDPEKAKEETAVKVNEFIVAFKKETGALKFSEIT